VIWLGCDPCPALQLVKKELDNQLSGLGIKFEFREFLPHLTLGRVKDLRQVNQLTQLITLYKDVVFQKQWIDYVVCYESKLSTKGPEYLPIKKFPLQ
jgi:2'-5' RNA ligase